MLKLEVPDSTIIGAAAGTIAEPVAFSLAIGLVVGTTQNLQGCDGNLEQGNRLTEKWAATTLSCSLQLIRDGQQLEQRR